MDPSTVRILVAYVPAGSGHQRAAEAIAAAFHQIHPEADVSLLDASEKLTPWYRWCYTRGYLSLIQSAPSLWGLLYFLTDIRILHSLVANLFRAVNVSPAAGLERLLLETQPDILIGTHFLPMEVAAFLKKSRNLRMQLICVITDYIPHAFWLSEGIDTYVVGCVRAKEDLLNRGISSHRIQVLGIPVDPKFHRRGDRIAIAKRLGFDPSPFTILIGSGGAGTGPVAQLVTELGKVREPIQLVVITGKNASLFKTLENVRQTFPHPMRVEGFVHNMDEWMDLSDLLLTKPGGLTCAEALTKGIPMVLYNPIPGQETRNAKFLEEAGATILVERIADIRELMVQLIHDRSRLETLRQNAKKVRFPDAALEIARRALVHPAGNSQRVG